MKTFESAVLLFSALAVVLLLHQPLSAQTPPPTGQLKVSVDDIKSKDGKLVVKVFRKEDDLFGKPFREEVREISGPNMSIEFGNVSYGTYSIFAYHDKNGNGKLDHNFMGLPAEPMGWSNHWHFGALTGMPTFEKTKFVFSAENSALAISLK